MFLEWIFFGKDFCRENLFLRKRTDDTPLGYTFCPRQIISLENILAEKFFFSSRKIFSREKSCGDKKNVNPTVAFSLNLGIKNLERG